MKYIIIAQKTVVYIQEFEIDEDDAGITGSVYAEDLAMQRAKSRPNDWEPEDMEYDVWVDRTIWDDE